MSRAVVLLHGFTQTRASWDGVAARLHPRYRPLALDLRGHGSARDARPVGLDEVVADVSAAVPDEAVALAGYSMGGRIALHVALARPQRVSRLVLIGASPGLADPAEREARRRADEALARELEATTIEDFAQRWGAQPLFAGQPPEVAAAAREDRLRNDPHALAAALRGLGTGALPPVWDRLAELTIPVVLLVGERDAKFRAVAAAMAERLPRADLHVVAGAGHAVQLEAPAAVAALLGP